MTKKKIVRKESKIQLDGIYKQGYGIISKLVMKDPNLSIEAKSIYAYLCTYTGGGDSCYPSVPLQCSDLNITNKRYLKHRKMLEENGYIKIIKNRELAEFEDGTKKEIAANNIYVLVTSLSEIEELKNKKKKSAKKKIVSSTIKQVADKESKNNTNTTSTVGNTKFVQHGRFDHIQNDHIQNDYTNNNNTNNNNINNNIIINKKEKKKVTKQNRGKTNFELLIEEFTDNLELQETLKDFIKHRFVIKKPLTDRALKLLLTSLRKLSEIDSEKIEIINYSIVGGYSIFYPLKEKKETINNDFNTLNNNKTLKFSNYNQREYDFNQLEEELIGWIE